MKKSSLVVMLTLFTIILTLTVFSSCEKSYECTSSVVDRDNVLSKAQEEQIYAELCEAEKKTEIPIVIAVFEQRNGIPNEYDILSMTGFDGMRDDVVMLVIEVGDTNYYEMFTYGVADTLILQSVADSILDNSSVYSNIKNGRLCDGISAFITLSSSAIRSSRVKTVIIILVIAAISAAAAVGAVVFTYKKKQKSPSYPLNDFADLSLTEKSDVFLGKTVTKVRISSSTDGGGHGGKGGGGSGSRGRR